MAGGAPLPVREYTSADEMRQHAAEVRARLFAPRRMPGAAPQSTVEILEDLPGPKPWSQPQIQEQGFVASQPVPPELRDKFAPFPMRRMVAIVGVVSGVSRAEILSAGKAQRIVKARQITYWLGQTFSGLTLPQISRGLGGRHHTSALWGIRKVQAVMKLLDIEVTDDPVEMAETLWAAEWPKALV